MDIQYFGGNCVTLADKGMRIVVDDTLSDLGVKSIIKQSDVVLFTDKHDPPASEVRLLVDMPGEYEVANTSIIGIAARGHRDEPGTSMATMYKIIADDTTYLVAGNIYPQLNDEQLEAIGMVDVMIVPVGGNGYTLDAGGALQLIKAIEPKVVIPTHYADSAIEYPVEQQALETVLKNIGMEVHETTGKFRFKPAEASTTTQLIVVSRS